MVLGDLQQAASNSSALGVRGDGDVVDEEVVRLGPHHDESNNAPFNDRDMDDVS